MNRKLIFLYSILLALILGHSIYRDIILEKQYMGDLRNRMVGARLEHEGKLPYNYVWQARDGIRYYDVNNTNKENNPSNITASPFFHQLFIPIAELSFRNASVLWLWLQYLFLAAILFMNCKLTPNESIRWVIISAGILFTTTEAWKNLIATGQIYLFEGLLMCMIMFGLERNKKQTIIPAALIAVIFILTRPIGLVFLIPFVFFYRRYFLFLNTIGITFLIYLIFVLTSTYQKSLYQNYGFNLAAQVRIHQSIQNYADTNKQVAVYRYPDFEGFDMNASYRIQQSNPIPVYIENSNFFVLYNKITNTHLSLWWLNVINLATIGILSLIFLIRNWKQTPSLVQIMLFGFFLYMLEEFFSPIHRHQYSTVLWLPVIFMACRMPSDRKTAVYIFLSAGLFLNIVNFPWLPMRHTLGEICWMIAMLILAFPDMHNKKTLSETERV